MPPAARWIHNTVGLFFYCLLTFAPVNVGCELLSCYTINYIADHFKIWSDIFQQMTSSELDFEEAAKQHNLQIDGIDGIDEITKSTGILLV